MWRLLVTVSRECLTLFCVTFHEPFLSFFVSYLRPFYQMMMISLFPLFKLNSVFPLTRMVRWMDYFFYKWNGGFSVWIYLDFIRCTFVFLTDRSVKVHFWRIPYHLKICIRIHYISMACVYYFVSPHCIVTFKKTNWWKYWSMYSRFTSALCKSLVNAFYD